MSKLYEFVECESCSSKPGVVVLCTSCLHNRYAINALTDKNIDLSIATEKSLSLIQTHYLDYWGIDSRDKDYEPIAEIHKILNK